MNWRAVTTLLQWRWSPQQIVAALKRVFGNEPQRHGSHESIYNAIYATHPKGELRRELIALPRRRQSKRMPRS